MELVSFGVFQHMLSFGVWKRKRYLCHFFLLFNELSCLFTLQFNIGETHTHSLTPHMQKQIVVVFLQMNMSCSQLKMRVWASEKRVGWTNGLELAAPKPPPKKYVQNERIIARDPALEVIIKNKTAIQIQFFSRHMNFSNTFSTIHFILSLSLFAKTYFSIAVEVEY